MGKSLKEDIKKAFVKASGAEQYGDGNAGNIDALAGDLRDAIIDFLEKQTWTITEMKAILEVEEMSTLAPLMADVLPSVTTTIPIGTVAVSAGGPAIPSVVPIPTVVNAFSGKKGVKIPSLKLKKGGGQGGSMRSKGYAYIGRPAGRVRGSGDADIAKWNTRTKVQLDPTKIRGK